MYYEKIITDWEGKLYCGITIKWNHTKIYVDISMPGLLKEYLCQFCHETPIKPQHQPYPAPEQTYGADAQKMKPLDTSPALPTERVKIIEHIIVKFCYYARGIENTCLVPLIAMSTINDSIE